jgi:hypothetical protein
LPEGGRCSQQFDNQFLQPVGRHGVEGSRWLHTQLEAQSIGEIGALAGMIETPMLACIDIRQGKLRRPIGSVMIGLAADDRLQAIVARCAEKG